MLSGLLLVACGDTGQSNPTPAVTAANGSPKAPINITWSFWGSDEEVAINQKLVNQFEKFNSNIKVNTVYDSWDNYYTRLEKDWIGNKAPDVMFLENTSTYASMNMLESLDPYLAKEKDFKLEDFYPGLLELNRFNNKLYGLPRDNDTKVIFVNLKLLREAGLEKPKGGWTWNNLLEYARKLTKQDAAGTITQYGYAFEPNDWWRLWMWQNEVEFFDKFSITEPPTRFNVNSPDAINAIQFFADLINKEKVTPLAADMDTSDEISALFAAGKLGMAFGNHALVPFYSKTKGLEWDVVPLPAGKKRVNILDGAGYVINTGSKNKEAAWEFVKFLSSELGQGFFMESGVVVPARQSIREDNIYVRDSKFDWKVFIEETRFGRLTPQFRNFNKISKLVDKELEEVWKGQKSAVTVLTALPSKIEPELAKLRQ
jgi:multiple sugar transport system substrate-binding protein